MGKMVNGYVRNCYLNWACTINDWKYRRMSIRGRRILWAAMGHNLDSIVADGFYGESVPRIEASNIMFKKFLELGGFKK